jgi:hypothetical protein
MVFRNVYYSCTQIKFMQRNYTSTMIGAGAGGLLLFGLAKGCGANTGFSIFWTALGAGIGGLVGYVAVNG